jgi:hypothetical protein
MALNKQTRYYPGTLIMLLAPKKLPIKTEKIAFIGISGKHPCSRRDLIFFNGQTRQINKYRHLKFPIFHLQKIVMKKTFAFLFILIAMTTIATAQNHPGKLLRHVVLFKFKDGTTAADTKKVEDAFRALPSKIKEIKSLEWGTNNSPENLNQGFTHCFFVTFNSEKDRAVYLPHPAHKAFGEILHPYLDKVLVLDFWAQK